MEEKEHWGKNSRADGVLDPTAHIEIHNLTLHSHVNIDESGELNTDPPLMSLLILIWYFREFDQNLHFIPYIYINTHTLGLWHSRVWRDNLLEVLKIVLLIYNRIKMLLFL